MREGLEYLVLIGGQSGENHTPVYTEDHPTYSSEQTMQMSLSGKESFKNKLFCLVVGFLSHVSMHQLVLGMRPRGPALGGDLSGQF